MFLKLPASVLNSCFSTGYLLQYWKVVSIVGGWFNTRMCKCTESLSKALLLHSYSLSSKIEFDYYHLVVESISMNNP